MKEKGSALPGLSPAVTSFNWNGVTIGADTNSIVRKTIEDTVAGLIQEAADKTNVSTPRINICLQYTLARVRKPGHVIKSGRSAGFYLPLSFNNADITIKTVKLSINISRVGGVKLDDLQISTLFDALRQIAIERFA